MKENKYKPYLVFFTVTAFLAFGSFYMINGEMPPWAYKLSGVNIVLFAAPAMWATIKWLGWKNGMILLVALGVYAMLIETFAITTGFPYGNFSYSEMLGSRLFGVVPWTVAFAWTPLILAAYPIARRLISTIWVRIIVTAFILLAFDTVLDPGAVYLNFWKYEGGGFFYGVPLSNFAGWILSGLIGAGIFEFLIYLFKTENPSPPEIILSAYFIVIFWTFLALWAGMLIPFFIGIFIIAALSIYYPNFSK